jgi:hypothetical protein
MFNTKKFNRNKLDQGFSLFNILFRVLAIIASVIFVGIVCFYIFIGSTVYNNVDTVKQTGIKGAVERIWCGQNIECKF